MRKATILMTMLLILACVQVAHARTYLVSAGVNRYPAGIPDLHLCVNDAKAVNGIFKYNGDDNVCALLTDADATVSNVKMAMQYVFGQAGHGDAVILFFSGHGIPGAFCCVDGYLFYTDILNILRQSRASYKMVMADACFSGKMRKSNKRQQQAFKKANVMLFLSSRSNETSLEGQALVGYRNGFFTTYLEKGLRGEADANRDHVITARELYDFVHENVVNATRKQQHPVMWGSFDRNMPVIKW